MKIIEIHDLVKTYGQIEAVKSISFHVSKGEFVAFLGENGAGKSTTINIISTLLKKTAGQVVVNGKVLDKDDSEIRKDIGVVFQNKMLDDFLTVQENILCRGRLYGLSDSEINKRLVDIGDKIGINEFMNRKYGKLSGGQRRRADIARALINLPKVLILDEPTTGLDPYTRQSVWECIENLQNKTKLTVFLTTHYMDEAAKADRIIMIDKGVIVENDTPEKLKLKYSHDVLKMYPNNIANVEKTLNEQNIRYKREKECLLVNLKSSLDSIGLINNIKDKLLGFEVICGSMDQVFMALASSEKEQEK